VADADQKPLIRYFCEVTDQANPDQETWGDIGFDYLEALVDAGFAVRVLAHGAMQYAPGTQVSRWETHRALFGTPMQADYINVVCGSTEMLCQYWTQGPKNIAITADLGTDETSRFHKAVLEKAIRTGEDTGGIHAKYDLVACLTESEAAALCQRGVVAMHLQPKQLARTLR
jgi:hypothetical protein